MQALLNMSRNLSKLNQDEVIKELVEKNAKFITTNVQGRLLGKGTDMEGKPIKTYSHGSGLAYSAYTVEEKKKKGQEHKHVTLRDTGSFYRSMEVDADNSSYSLIGDEDKPDGKISDNLDLENAFGQSPDGVEKLQGLMIPDLQDILLSTLRA